MTGAIKANKPWQDKPDMPTIVYTFGSGGPDENTQAEMDKLNKHFREMSAYMYRGFEYIVLSCETVIGDPLIEVYYQLQEKPEHVVA